MPQRLAAYRTSDLINRSLMGAYHLATRGRVQSLESCIAQLQPARPQAQRAKVCPRRAWLGLSIDKTGVLAGERKAALVCASFILRLTTAEKQRARKPNCFRVALYAEGPA